MAICRPGTFGGRPAEPWRRHHGAHANRGKRCVRPCESDRRRDRCRRVISGTDLWRRDNADPPLRPGRWQPIDIRSRARRRDARPDGRCRRRTGRRERCGCWGRHSGELLRHGGDCNPPWQQRDSERAPRPNLQPVGHRQRRGCNQSKRLDNHTSHRQRHRYGDTNESDDRISLYEVDDQQHQCRSRGSSLAV